MEVWRFVVVFILSLFVTLSVVFFILGMGGWKLFDEQIYYTAIDESGFYSSLDKYLGLENGSRMIIAVDSRNVISPMIRNALSYFRGDSDELNLVIELNPATLRSFLEDQVSFLPQCLPGENPFIKDRLDCIPTGMNSSQFLDELIERENIDVLKDGRVDLKDVYGIEDSNLDKIRSYVILYKKALVVSLSVFFVCFFLIFLVSGASIKISFGWVGADIIFGSLIVFVLYSVFNILFNDLVSQNYFGYPFIASIFSQIMEYILFLTIITFILGLFLLILSVVIGRKN